MNINKLAKNALCMVLIIFSVTVSTHIKNSVYRLENELKQLELQNKEDAQNIHVLNAEWSNLNNPARLRALAKKHIALKPVKAEQIINYSALPFDYENGESRKLAARKSISNYAEQKRDLKRLTSAQR